MDKNQISDVLDLSVDKLTEQLPALDGDPGDEQGDKTPTGGGEKVDPAPKGAGKIPATDFRHPDYTGPLDGEQAAWRVANIKPVREARTK